MTENLTELSPTADETEMLVFALERSRRQFTWKCGGLDAAGLSKQHPPTVMTLGGLIKHLALVEDYYMAGFGQPMGAPWATVDFDADPQWEWRTAADDTPEYLYALWHGAVDRSRATVAKTLADGGLDQPSTMEEELGEPRNLRRVLVDLHDEYARHVGHADLLREAVDGLVGEDPPRP